MSRYKKKKKKKNTKHCALRDLIKSRPIITWKVWQHGRLLT